MGLHLSRAEEVEVNRQPGQVSSVPAEEVVAPPVPEEPVTYIVLHIEGKKLDLVLKKLHNCGRYDTVES